MRDRVGVRPVLVLIGFTAAIAQIVLMRELMVVFYGNEISLGLMLASWLFWTAVGSGLAGRLTARAREPRRLMAGLEALVAVALPATILAVRASKGVLEAVPGESLGPGPMLLGSLATLSVFCVLSGSLFATGSRLYADQAATSTGEATGSVYLLEALGSAAGGVLAGLALVRYVAPLQIALGLGLLNLLAAAGLVIRAPYVRRAAMGALLGMAVLLALPFGLPRLETASLERFWRGFRLITTRNSVYGNLAVVQTEGVRSLYENGLNLFNAPDPAAAEEAVHYALLEHPSPRSLLLIGGGVNGSLVQALQHASLERIDYVELDPAILDLARKYFPKEWAPIQKDSRVRVHVTDGRLFLKTTASAFDVIIVNLPDPQTAQLNRFYTLEFFREAARKLTESGILSLQLRASEDYISPELAEFLRSIHKTLRAVFPEVTAIPGETVHFFAAGRTGVLAAGAEELLSRLQARRLETSYVREYYIPFRMMPDRVAGLARQIRPRPETPENRDFAPVAYYFDVALWSSRFNHGYRGVFRAMAGVAFSWLAAAAGVLLLMLVAGVRLLSAKERRLRATAACCTAAMGFTLIGLEMLLLLAFQAIYGCVYQQLAIVIAAFMAGMALGSWLALVGRVSDLPRQMRALAFLQALAALAPLLLYAVFEAITHVTSPVGLFLVSQLLFPALALLCGTLGGYEFPLASRIFFSSSRERSPGALYALDLAGSCLGAVLFSAWLVPVFGFLRTALLASMVSLAPAVMAMLPVSEAHPRE
ncbi:MAG: fused MFS/spermidine synthase [Bryobacteraceae bacterium]